MKIFRMIKNINKVNSLNRHELIAIAWAVKASPTPGNSGDKVYRNCLKAVKEADKLTPILPEISLIELRKGIDRFSKKAETSPYNTYLTIAFDIKKE